MCYDKNVKMIIKDKIKSLRVSMVSKSIDACIIPSNDIHFSEYVADHWKCREWISGFTGSAGTIVVTKDKAGLWTDSRYFLQAETELVDTGIQLYKPQNRFAPEHVEWLANELEEGSTVLIDGNLCTLNQQKKYSTILSKSNIGLSTSYDLFDEIWKDRPAIPTFKIEEHDITFAGKSRVQKLDEVRERMNKQGVDYHLITTLDDIAWLFNIRGRDVDFNPVAICFALVSRDSAILFIDNVKVEDDHKQNLLQDNILIKGYDQIIGHLNSLPQDKKLLVNESTCAYTIYRSINAEIVTGKTITTALKGQKNKTELDHVEKMMAKDGAALAKSFYWLEQKIKSGEEVTESDFAAKIAQCRSLMKYYKGESFPAIVGYKGNGAIIHYRPEKGKDASINAEGVLLCDSGGQYLDGTSDITRTIALGTPSKEEKRNFTLVLKGMVSLTRATFPIGTTGAQLDVFARMHLWEHGLNYGHGTGHGVGFFLNVHEGPQGISGMNSSAARVPLKEGMITSNEPGYYKEGHYGIRIENLISVVKSDNPGFYEFKTLTLYPIDIKLIDETIFNKSEKAWLNKYHYQVFKKVSPYLEGDVLSWFELKCRPMN